MKMVGRICLLTSELKDLLHPILPASTVINIWRRVRRICMFTSELEEFINHQIGHIMRKDREEHCVTALE